MGSYIVSGTGLLTVVKEDLYVAGRRVAPSDRLGSDLTGGVRLLPYGEDIANPPVANNRTKFATYYRDSSSGYDYADQRYYSPGWGRFLSADPYVSTGGTNPGRWNMYSYVLGDPVNKTDASGLDDEKDFCQIYPGHPVCGPFFPQPGGPPPVEPQSSDSETQVGAHSDRQGKKRALSGLYSISGSHKIAGEQCKRFFEALSPGHGEAVAAQVRSVASVVASSAYIYDGPSSSTPLTEDAFPGAAGDGDTTVGEWFRRRGSNAHGLSQVNGGAIFLVLDEWEGLLSSMGEGTGASSYGRGLLLHELLHKSAISGGFSHQQIIAALRDSGAPGGILGQEDIASRLGQSCFRD